MREVSPPPEMQRVIDAQRTNGDIVERGLKTLQEQFAEPITNEQQQLLKKLVQHLKAGCKLFTDQQTELLACSTRYLEQCRDEEDVKLRYPTHPLFLKLKQVESQLDDYERRLQGTPKTIETDSVLDESDIATAINRGHTIDRHVKKDVQFLDSRFWSNPKDGGRLDEQAQPGEPMTTFFDQKTAQQSILKTLQANRLPLTEWLASRTPIKRLQFDVGTDIGFGILKGECDIRFSTRAAVVLRREVDFLRGYYVLTAYPVL